MDKVQDLTDRIARRPDAEARFGITFGALSAFLRTAGDGEARLAVAGEVIATAGETPAQDIVLIASAHDASGRVLYVLQESVPFGGFFRLRAFVFTDFGTLPRTDVTAVKLYPSGY